MKAGIIGGLTPEATVHYYKSIIDTYRNRVADGSYPEIIIDSIDMVAILRLMDAGKVDKIIEMLLHSLECLFKAGAQVAVIVSNTSHVVLEALKERSPLPLLCIVEETYYTAAALHLRKVGLLGNSFTMNGRSYKDGFAARGIEVIVPKEDERQYIHEKIFSELEAGLVKPETKANMIKIIDRMASEENIGAVIFSCTELSLILHDGDCTVPHLDSVQIHVNALVRYMTWQGGRI